jgi:2'-5' RNA ligase
MRLFVALEITSAVREALANTAATLKPESDGVRWSRPAALHVTLKFLGETDVQKLDSIRAVLAKINSPEWVALRFRGVGFFPDEIRPRVMWCGIEATPNLRELAASLDRSLELCGVPAEARAFVPHVTLARLNSARNVQKLVRAAAPLKSYDFGAARESEFHLFESVLKPSGSEYQKLSTFSFVKDAP